MKEFADKCDVSKYAIKKLIAGDFTIRGSNLIKVAEALKISSNMLYEDIKETKEENKKNIKNWGRRKDREKLSKSSSNVIILSDQ